MTDERFTSSGGYDRRHAVPVIVVISLQPSQVVLHFVTTWSFFTCFLLRSRTLHLSVQCSLLLASETRLDWLAYYGRAMHDSLDRSAFE